MEALVVGFLGALTFTLGAALWMLLVRPEVFAPWRGAVTAEEDWFEEHPATLGALRWVLGGLLALLGFLTGLATAFLGSTA